MRRIGTLNSERDARAFSDYLFTLKIDTQVSGQDGSWDIWLLDEDQLEQGRRELESFRADPNDAKYAAAAGIARAQRDAELQAVLTAAKQHIDLRQRWERPIWRQMPVTIGLLVISAAVTLYTQSGMNRDRTALLQVQTVDASGRYISRPILFDVRSGEVWRLVTPIFIHMGFWHLVFNASLMLAIGGLIERERGSLRLLLFVLVTAVISNLAQHFASGPLFGGLSGIGYGLFGYVWLVGRFEPQSGLQISRESTVLMVVWLFLCTTGLVGPVANYCHFVGLAVGLAWAGVEVLWRRSRA
jgi:GlpG protein